MGDASNGTAPAAPTRGGAVFETVSSYLAAKTTSGDREGPSESDTATNPTEKVPVANSLSIHHSREYNGQPVVLGENIRTAIPKCRHFVGSTVNGKHAIFDNVEFRKTIQEYFIERLKNHSFRQGPKRRLSVIPEIDHLLRFAGQVSQTDWCVWVDAERPVETSHDKNKQIPKGTNKRGTMQAWKKRRINTENWNEKTLVNITRTNAR